MTYRDPLWVGISKHGAGWRASVSRGRGVPLLQRHFPKDTDPRVMQDWRKDTKAKLRLTRKQRSFSGMFAFDVTRYLRAVTTMRTFPERQRHLALWVDVFRGRMTADLTAAEIRAHTETWLTEPRSKDDPRPLAPNTINKRLRALSNLFTVLGLDNPVRHVPEAREPEREPIDLPYETIRVIIAHCPDRRAGTHGAISKSKIRIRCLAFCALTPQHLMDLKPADLELSLGMMRQPSRRKGGGADAIWVPLTPEGLAALTDFDRYDCYGPFNSPSINRVFQRGARKAGVTEHVHVYQLRHSFATLTYNATGSLEATGKLLQHVNPATTLKYAKRAHAGVLAGTVARVSEALSAGITKGHDGPMSVGQNRPKTANGRTTPKSSQRADARRNRPKS